jgi:hypothetical protein
MENFAKGYAIEDLNRIYRSLTTHSALKECRLTVLSVEERKLQQYSSIYSQSGRIYEKHTKD